MSIQLVIAEKPSVARSIAGVIGADQKRDGYMEGNGYLVSWCIGHLVSLADAGAYDERFKKWRYDDLPILPQEWQYIIPAEKKGQFAVLRSLMERPDVTGLVCATDAGREGELIFRFVYQMAGCKKPFKRLWISSMEDAAIREGFAHLKPGADYDDLYQSALCRAQADWLVGINATRLFSILYHKTLTVGRVQTPTLNMLVDREAKISNFKKEKYHVVHIAAGSMEAASDRFMNPDDADATKTACVGAQAVCVSVKREKKTEQPPRLYDLTSLQREANRLFGFTAKQTLDYAQQNERNVKNRHPERNKETGDLLKSKKTCPEETVYQIGTLDNHVPPELLIEIVTEFMEIVNERFGSHVHILNWALHLDESTPHIHERHVFDCENQYGEIAPQQEKALEALGFELPEPEKPVGRKNNRKMTFDSACRVLLFDVAKKHGLQLEEEPEYGGRAYLEKQDYILFKQKEQLAAQEQKLEELTMKIEDVEALVDEVADIAYDKAVEVVADTVKLETHKEDIKLVEQSKAWVLSPERKASKKEVEYAVKRLDGVIARITNAMKSTIQKIQTTLMKPEVKKAGTEQIKKKAKSSIIEQLSRKKKEIAEREVSRTDQAKSKKQDMEL